MCDWKTCTTATNRPPNPNERMPRTRMSWIPRSLYICPTRLAVFLLGRKDLRALGALRIDDNQAFTTANRALFGADEILAATGTTGSTRTRIAGRCFCNPGSRLYGMERTPAFFRSVTAF